MLIFWLWYLFKSSFLKCLSKKRSLFFLEMRTLNKSIFLAQIAYCTDFLTVFLWIVQRNLNLPSLWLRTGGKHTVLDFRSLQCAYSSRGGREGPSSLHRFWDKSLDIGEKVSQSAPTSARSVWKDTQVCACLCPGLSGADMNAPRCSALRDI